MSKDKENQIIEEPEVNAGQQAGSDFGGYDQLITLTPREHIRLRPGMYIGKLGDGSQNDDGIYVLIKEVIDNSIDEFNTGYAKPTIDIDVADGAVTIRDYGRGIPLDQVKAASSKMNTGAKYDTQTYKRSVGLNGVGIKAVNALSTEFYIRSVRDGQCASVTYSEGVAKEESGVIAANEGEENGTPGMSGMMAPMIMLGRLWPNPMRWKRMQSPVTKKPPTMLPTIFDM